LNSGRKKGKLTKRIVAGTQDRSNPDRGAKGFFNFIKCGLLGSEYTGFSSILRVDATISLAHDGEAEAKVPE